MSKSQRRVPEQSSEKKIIQHKPRRSGQERMFRFMRQSGLVVEDLARDVVLDADQAAR